MITAAIEDTTRAGIAALVKHDFDIDRYRWIHSADDFHCIDATVMGATTFNKLGGPEMLHRTTHKNPACCVNIFSLSSHVY